MKKMKMAIAALAAVFAAATLYAQTPEEVTAKYNEAAALINQKQFAAAIPVLDQVVEMGLEAGDASIETVQNAQKLLPKCYFYVGGSNLMKKNYPTALEDFGKAAELGELYGDMATARKANSYIGQIYTAMGGEAFNAKDYAKAAEIFAKGYQADPRNTALALNLAMSYCEMGDLDKGTEVYSRIIALGDNPKYAEDAATAKARLSEYLLLNASRLASEGKTDEAYAMIDRLLAVEPDNALAQMLRIQVATNAKAYDKVIEWGGAAAEAQATPELKSDAYFLLGAAYQNTENKAMAIENYRKVVAGDKVAVAKEQIALLSK